MGEITPKTEGNVGSHGSGWWLTSGWAIPTFAAFVPHAPMADPAGKNPLRTPRWLRGLVTIPVRARNYEKDIVPMFFGLFRNILTPPPPKKKGIPSQVYWVALYEFPFCERNHSKPSNPRSRMSFISLVILRLQSFQLGKKFLPQKTYHDTNWEPTTLGYKPSF